MAPVPRKVCKTSKPKNDDRLDFSLSSEPKRVIGRAAALSVQTVKQFAVCTFVSSAEEALERRRTIHLFNRDRDSSTRMRGLTRLSDWRPSALSVTVEQGDMAVKGYYRI